MTAAIIIALGFVAGAWMVASALARGVDQVKASLLVRAYPAPDEEEGDLIDEEDLQRARWNPHLPPFSDEEAGFGEALLYQLARLAAVHERLAAAIERLGAPQANSGEDR